MLGLEPGQLRVVCPWVGGGFGPKAAPYVEHLVAAAAALALNRPVKWVETRSEDMVSLVHGRDFVMTAKLGVASDGKIVGFDGSVVASAGAYPGIGAILPMLTQMMSVGVYAIPNVRFNGTTVMTNNTTIGAYRGAGRPEATQLIERVLDVAADQIGGDVEHALDQLRRLRATGAAVGTGRRGVGHRPSLPSNFTLGMS